MLSANHGTNGSYVSEMSPGFRRSHAGNIGMKIQGIAGTYQATLSALSLIDKFSSSLRSRSNFRMQFRRRFPEYLAGARP